MAAARRRDRGGEYWVDFRYRGRRVRRRSPVQTRRGAEQFERQLRVEMGDDEQGGRDPFAGPPPRFADFAERWMRDYVEPRNRFATRYEKRCALRARLLPEFGEMRLDQINTAQVEAAVARWRSIPLSAKRINNLLTVLRRSLASAKDWGLLRAVPVIRQLRAPPPVPQYITREQFDRVLAELEPGIWRTLVIFVFTTGVRYGEAAALRWDDLVIDADQPYVFIQRSLSRDARHTEEPKTPASRRPVGLLEETVAALRALPRDAPWVFQKPGGGFYRSDYAAHHLKTACERAGIAPVSWHVLRHSCATELVRHGTPLRVVQDILGHTSIAMTCRYAHVAPSTAFSYMQSLSSRPSASPLGHQVVTKASTPGIAPTPVATAVAQHSEKPGL